MKLYTTREEALEAFLGSFKGDYNIYDAVSFFQDEIIQLAIGLWILRGDI
jgi:hypothetical protein